MCRRLSFKPIFPRLPNEELWEWGGRGGGAAEGGEHGGRKGPGAKKYFGAKEAARVFSFRLKTNKRIVESKICSGGVKEEGGAVAH